MGDTPQTKLTVVVSGGSVPRTGNRFAIIVSGVVHTVFTIGLVAGREALKTYLPFLRLPIISPIFDFIVDHYGAQIDAELQIDATFVVIDIQEYVELQSYNRAKDALAKAQTIGEQEAIANAQADYKKKLADLIHWDGST